MPYPAGECRYCHRQIEVSQNRICKSCRREKFGSKRTENLNVTPKAPEPAFTKTRQERIALMEQRAARGEHITHPDDRMASDRHAADEGEADWQVEEAKRNGQSSQRKGVGVPGVLQGTGEED